MRRGIAIAAAAILIPALGLHGCSSKESRLRAHMERAKDYYARGMYDKAGLELRNVLQMDPKVGEAYYYVGLIEEKRDNARNAFANFVRATELNPDNLDAKLKLGRLYLFGGNAEMAGRIADQILAQKPGDPGTSTLKAAALARKGETAAAQALATNVIAADPRQTDAVALLAGLYREQQKLDDSRSVLESGIAANPADAGLRLSLVSYYLHTKSFERAEQQYLELVRIEPNTFAYRNGLAQLYLKAGQGAKAEKALRDAVEANPKDEQRRLVLADFMAASGRGQEAIAELRSATQAAPNSYGLRFGLAGLLRMQDQNDAAQAEYDKIIKEDAQGLNGLRARNELADLQLVQGRPDEAARLVADVLKVNPRDNQALLLRSRLSLQKGDALSAIADLRAVLKDQPNSLDVLSRLARAHLSNNEPKLAVELAGSAVELYPYSPTAKLLLAEMRFGAGERAEAMREVDELLKVDPSNYQALLTRAMLQAAQQDFSAAEHTLWQAQQAYPNDAMVPYRIGTLQLGQKKYELAIRSFEQALERAPESIEPLAGLVSAYLSQGQADQAAARVTAALARKPDDYQLEVLLGRIYAQQNKDAQAETAFVKAVELKPRLAATHGELANYYLGRKRFDQGVAALREGLRALPADHGLSHRLAQVLGAYGKTDDAIHAYEAILQTSPGDDLAANNLAALLLDTRRDQASFQRALEVSKRFAGSHNSAFVDSLGWAYYRVGQYDQAVQFLSKASDSAPNVAVFHYHLGMALYKQGRLETGKEHLQKAVQNGGKDPALEEARRILGKS